MSKVLWIKGSPRSRSHSTGVAEAFVDAYLEKNPEDKVVTFDVFGENLLDFNEHVLNTKYKIMQGLEETEEEALAWKAVENLIEEFKSFDKYIISTAMWNFGIPYRLKQYIDIIVQPTYTFSFSPEEGYKGLVTGKPVFISYARGGEYPAGTDAAAIDFQKPYLDFVLGFIGFTDIKSVVTEPTLSDEAKAKREAAIEEAKKIAETF